MNGLHRAILILSSVLGSWLAMQALHELGHMTTAWMTGGQVAGVVLHPLRFSRTELGANPHPLTVAWAGPVLGVLLPLAVWGAGAALRLQGAYVLRFFAGFCLIANGAYLALGSFDGIGDCGDLLRHGAPRWQLWLFGALAAPLGLALWHGQGRHFGLGPEKRPVSPGVAYAALAGFVALLVLGFAVGGA